MKYGFTTLVFSLLSAPLAFAQEQAAAGAAGPSQSSGLMGIMPLFAIVFFIFYFLVIRPQDKEQRAHQQLLEALTPGTWVLTNGGIIGKVFSVNEDEVVLEVANNVRSRFVKSAILRTVDQESESKGKSSANNDKAKRKKTA